MTSGLEAGIVLEKMSKDYPMFVQSLLLPNCSPWCQPRVSHASLLLLPLALFWSREFLQPGEAPGWAFAACWSPAFLLALLLLDTEVLTSGGKAKIAPKPAPKQCCVFSTWRLMWWHLWDDFPCPQPAWKCYSSQTAPTAWTSQLFHSLGVFVGFILAGRTPLLLLPWPFPAVTA